MKPHLVVLPPWAITLGRTEQGYEPREPTAADLVAFLASRPEVRRELVRGLYEAHQRAQAVAEMAGVGRG